MKVKVKLKLVLVSVIIDSMLVILINCSSRTLKCILSKYFSFLIDFWLKENKLTKIKMLHLVTCLIHYWRTVEQPLRLFFRLHLGNLRGSGQL